MAEAVVVAPGALRQVVTLVGLQTHDVKPVQVTGTSKQQLCCLASNIAISYNDTYFVPSWRHSRRVWRVLWHLRR